MSNVFVPLVNTSIEVINTCPVDINLLKSKNSYLRSYLLPREEVECIHTFPSANAPHYGSAIIPQLWIEDDSDIFGLPVNKVVYSSDGYRENIIGMPNQKPGIFYIVSPMIAVAAARIGRKDCLFPGLEVRNIELPVEVLGYYWLYKA